MVNVYPKPGKSVPGGKENGYEEKKNANGGTKSPSWHGPLDCPAGHAHEEDRLGPAKRGPGKSVPEGKGKRVRGKNANGGTKENGRGKGEKPCGFWVKIRSGMGLTDVLEKCVRIRYFLVQKQALKKGE